MSTVNGGWRGPNIVKDGLILYLDPGSPNSYYNKTNTNIKDISGNGYDGTLTNFGSQTIYDSGSGGSIVFDGTDDYCSLPIYNYGTGDYTWSFWLKCSSQTGTFLGQGSWISTPANTGGALSILVRNDSGLSNMIACYLGDQPGNNYKYITSTANAYTNNIWFNVVVTWNFSTKTPKIYVNNNLISTSVTSLGTVTTLTPTNTSGKFQTIGTYDNTRLGTFQYNGNISQALIYNRELSAAEVLQNFNATKTRFSDFWNDGFVWDDTSVWIDTY